MMDMTLYSVRMFNKKEIKESVSIVKGNKQVESQLQLGTY